MKVYKNLLVMWLV